MFTEANPSPRLPVPDVCRILHSNVLGVAGNHGDLAVASSPYDTLLFSETLVLDMRHASELRCPDLVALCCYVEGRCLGPERWLHTYKIVIEHFAN